MAQAAQRADLFRWRHRHLRLGVLACPIPRRARSRTDEEPVERRDHRSLQSPGAHEPLGNGRQLHPASADRAAPDLRPKSDQAAARGSRLQ